MTARRACWVTAGLAAAYVVAACASAAPSRDVHQVTTTSGSLAVAAPVGWQATREYRLLDPPGEGLQVAAGKAQRMKVYASATALAATLGDDPTSDLYTFRHLVQLVAGLDRFGIGAGCTHVARRPVEGSGFYGEAVVVEGCTRGQPAEVRAALLDDRRTTVVWLTVTGADAEEAMTYLSAAVDGLRVDRNQLPSGTPLG